VNNMQPWYASGARSLLETRKQGLTPQGPIVVSLVGQSFPHTTLYCRPDVPAERFDWRMLVNLEVWVWASAAIPMDWITATVWRIANVRPKELALRFEHQDCLHDIDCGSGHHHAAIGNIPASHGFCWLPLNTSGTELGSRIKKALTAQHKLGQFL
jgi:hypothetical protein